MKVLAVLGALTVMASATQVHAKVAVVSGAKAVTATEKVDVTGRDCGCSHTPAPAPSKPGYGFGTTGHYGPPGQGFTPADNWRNHAAGDGLTPTGRALPPRAF
ncbi:MAG: hypothetical protein KY445_05790 [Armatimonadetes bacterium]|nr:hypothetical protein [Armatimonadota bacterium]